ncbi:hypothetical protein [Peptoniphilus senegalensis]|uniref:hypothetical protein n=1 Tax=Peptoniphilus senegalensis TaxID=1465757 RepID=UPI0002DDD8C6|nr:hypothetical protein [Peptoniphilus senegalensis]
MNKKNLLIKILIVLNIVLLCSTIILQQKLQNPMVPLLKGTYVCFNKDFYSMSFDTEEKVYYIFCNGSLIEKGNFKEDEDKRIYKLEDNDFNKYIFLNGKTFYFAISDDKVIKFEKESNAITFYGELKDFK